MKRALLFAAFGLATVLFPGHSFAQPSQHSTSNRPASLYGLSESQITDRYGKPDDVKTKSDKSAEWFYGQSSVFFLEGRVSAWSDAGELQQRERLTALQADKHQRDDSLSEQWVNPWTPPAKR